MFIGLQSKMCDELGTEKMFAIYELMLNDFRDYESREDDVVDAIIGFTTCKLD